MSVSEPLAPVPPPSDVPADATTAGFDWKKLLHHVTPAISLGLGITSQVFARHTVSFAPRALMLLVVAWTLAGGIGQWLPEPKDGEPHARWRALLRKAAATATVSLFRNVLFFLVPVWFSSATASSLNMVAPLMLAAGALFSCFPELFRSRVLERPRARTLWCSGVLFAALVPATAVETSASPRLSIAAAAAVSWIIAAVLTGRAVLGTRRGRQELLVTATLAAIVCASVAPLLPPVPVACRAAATGIGVKNRELEGEATRFPAGTKRVVAWFAVYVPPHYRQGIRFEWYRNGRSAGHVSGREVVGGREQGFRTSSFINAPQPGAWRVDVLTDASQLIARTRFVVE